MAIASPSRLGVGTETTLAVARSHHGAERGADGVALALGVLKAAQHEDASALAWTNPLASAPKGRDAAPATGR